MHTATTSFLVTVSSRSLTSGVLFENKDFTSALSLTEKDLECRGVTILFEDQEDLLPPGSSDGEDLRS